MSSLSASPRLLTSVSIRVPLVAALGCLTLLAVDIGRTKAADSPESSATTPGGAKAVPDAVAAMPASQIVASIGPEIRSSLASRGVSGTFQTFVSYVAGRLTATSGPYPTSEVTGNCRLKWYDHLMRNPLKAPVEVEEFSRQLHSELSAEGDGLARGLVSIREKMDLRRGTPMPFEPPTSPDGALEAVRVAVEAAQTGFLGSLAPLNRREIDELNRYLYPVLCQSQIGHTVSDRGTARRLCDLMEKMDRACLADAADALAPLVDARVLDQLAAIPETGVAALTPPDGMTGTLIKRIITPAGTILVGGSGANTYDLNKLTDVAAVIDLGGDDVYREGQVTFRRPVLVLIDLAGNDTYRGTSPGIQGAAMVGVSMLIDRSGDDVYQARDVAQGSALCGMGILVDMAGDDVYNGLRRVQGAALGGFGILIDRSGRDSYHAAMWDQGFGGPLGFGVLEDREGNDRYYTGGAWPDSYPEHPGYEGWGQGLGAGIRQSASGGIGTLLEGSGDDVYEFDYIAHGGGYWCGLGFLRDFAGNDVHLGHTRKEYDGSARSQGVWQRFSNGFGCHYAMGFLIDDSGNDVYGGTIMGLGMAWDASNGFLIDLDGNDRYEATGGLTQGTGAQASMGVLFDYRGDDAYQGYGQGYASPSISYHDLPGCGGNFSFLIDYGGKDSFGCGAKNNSVSQRGAGGGFVIDRPSTAEQEQKSKETVQQPGANRTAGK